MVAATVRGEWITASLFVFPHRVAEVDCVFLYIGPSSLYKDNHSISILLSTLLRLGHRLEEKQVKGEDRKDSGSGLQLRFKRASAEQFLSLLFSFLFMFLCF